MRIWCRCCQRASRLRLSDSRCPWSGDLQVTVLEDPHEHRKMERQRHCCVDEEQARQSVPMRRRPGQHSPPRSGFGGFRFPPEVITVAVRWYLRYAMSYRDVEELLAERGIQVDHVSVYRWVQRFTPLLIDAARPCRHIPGDRWFVDETALLH